jgi:hypothetical protein
LIVYVSAVDASHIFIEPFVYANALNSLPYNLHWGLSFSAMIVDVEVILSDD